MIRYSKNLGKVWTWVRDPSRRFGVSRFSLGHFGLETFRSDHEILQKSYMFTF